MFDPGPCVYMRKLVVPAAAADAVDPTAPAPIADEPTAPAASLVLVTDPSASWDDPTALLRERAMERRLSAAVGRIKVGAGANPAFRRPPTDRPARQTL